jgi:hypothetical protein
MKTLLAKVTKSDVITEPFPHIVIQDALEKEVYSRLVSEYPSLDTLSQGADTKGMDSYSNRRLHYLANESLNDEQVSSFWKEFITLHTSNVFFQELLHIFQDSLLQIYPDFEEKYGNFDRLVAGIRKVDTFATADILLDALICVNTPVATSAKAVRRAHIDLPDKLFAGLFYMRDPLDTSTGGDLELYRFKQGIPDGFVHCEIADEYVEWVKTIKYERNVLVLFLNSIHSLHGVTARSLTNYPRYFVNLVGEVKQPLFNPWEYQEPSYRRYWRRFKNKAMKNFVQPYAQLSR